ncbi:hypothetical protein T01_14343 [Trichinella spiralis]|uniref:Uncharacterized protein n=1 Tax=Trichinella spiralis TaxID=6334 RepID=A0A0V1BJA5_TRISP|nr:hypothetical protein T01_14343 [Trichinella spiralis]
MLLAAEDEHLVFRFKSNPPLPTALFMRRIHITFNSIVINNNRFHQSTASVITLGIVFNCSIFKEKNKARRVVYGMNRKFGKMTHVSRQLDDAA